MQFIGIRHQKDDWLYAHGPLHSVGAVVLRIHDKALCLEAIDRRRRIVHHFSPSCRAASWLPNSL